MSIILLLALGTSLVSYDDGSLFQGIVKFKKQNISKNFSEKNVTSKDFVKFKTIDLVVPNRVNGSDTEEVGDVAVDNEAPTLESVAVSYNERNNKFEVVISSEPYLEVAEVVLKVRGAEPETFRLNANSNRRSEYKNLNLSYEGAATVKFDFRLRDPAGNETSVIDAALAEWDPIWPDRDDHFTVRYTN